MSTMIYLMYFGLFFIEYKVDQKETMCFNTFIYMQFVNIIGSSNIIYNN